MTTQTTPHPLSDPTIATAEPGAAEALRGLCAGEVFLPGDSGYDAARGAWSSFHDQRPAAMVFPHSAAEVQAVVREAAAAGLHVAPQSTGHNAGPLAARDLSGTVIVRTERMNAMSVDPERRTARVEGGAVWLPVVEAAGEHGLAALHGSSPDVGIAGYSLGGGMGWYARKLGLATNSLTAVELVLADGSLVRADATENPELFWALRGGGGNFGVVTALEFSLYRIASAYAGMMVWDLADAEPVLRRWAAWAPDAPDEVTSAFRILAFPPDPEVPAELRGRTVVMVNGAVLGTDAHGRELFDGLRALRPEIDTFDRVPAPSLARLHLDPEEPTPVVSDHSLLASLPDAAVDALLAETGPDAGAPLDLVELRQLGGAMGRDHEGGGVLSRMDGGFLFFAAAVPFTPEAGVQGLAQAALMTGALEPWSTGTTYLNFTENPADCRRFYGEAKARRLSGIRSAVDPAAVFSANHRIPLLFEDGRPAGR